MMMLTQKQLHRLYLTELVEKINNNNIPGVFVECGVKHGSTACRVATILRRPSYLFDTWKRFEGFSSSDGNDRRKKWIGRRNTKKAETNCKDLIKKYKLDDICKMIKGDVIETMPSFLVQKSWQVCFAHLDLDLYKPTLFCLEKLWPYMTGPIFVHDYKSKHWPGIKKCVDKFVKNYSDAHLYKYPDICACLIKRKNNEF